MAAAVLVLASFYLDADARAWIAQHQTAGMGSFMRAVSQYGDWLEHVGLGFVLLALAYFRRNKKWMRIFAAMILACTLAGAVTRVSVGPKGEEGDGSSDEASISADGTKIAFSTHATNLGDLPFSGGSECIVRDWTAPTPTNTVVSVKTVGTTANDCGWPALSGDGTTST